MLLQCYDPRVPKKNVWAYLHSISYRQWKNQLRNLGVPSFYILKQGITHVIKHHHDLRSKLSISIYYFLHAQDLRSKASSSTNNVVLLQLIRH